MAFRKRYARKRTYSKKRTYAKKRAAPKRRAFGRKRVARQLPAGLQAMRVAKRAFSQSAVRPGSAHVASFAALQAALSRYKDNVASIRARIAAADEKIDARMSN